MDETGMEEWMRQGFSVHLAPPPFYYPTDLIDERAPDWWDLHLDYILPMLRGRMPYTPLVIELGMSSGDLSEVTVTRSEQNCYLFSCRGLTYGLNVGWLLNPVYAETPLGRYSVRQDRTDEGVLRGIVVFYRVSEDRMVISALYAGGRPASLEGVCKVGYFDTGYPFYAKWDADKFAFRGKLFTTWCMTRDDVAAAAYLRQTEEPFKAL